MRLAFLTALPPAPTGIADYSAEVLALLAGRHAIDVFHAQTEVDRARLPASVAVEPVSAFLPRHRAHPYAVAVYQMGNGPDHAFLYEPLAQVPGLLVLHDLVLHHSRARTFLDSPAALAYRRDPGSAALRDAARRDLDRYRDEAAYSYPDQAGRLDQVQLATVGTLLPYAYPLFRLPVEASRVVAAHNDFILDEVREAVPGTKTARIPMAVEPVKVLEDGVARLRERYGLAAGTFVVGCFGLLTREKQIETVARAVGRAAAHQPGIRLLLVGPVPDADALRALLTRMGVLDRTVITGRVPFEQLPLYIEAADAVVHLRYPTARETSAALLRVLAQGRPTVISDLEHLADIPDDAVLRADLTDEEGAVTRAVLRLAADRPLRERLRARARAFVALAHSAARCRDGYEAALTAAAESPAPRRFHWPEHWPTPTA